VKRLTDQIRYASSSVCACILCMSLGCAPERADVSKAGPPPAESGIIEELRMAVDMGDVDGVRRILDSGHAQKLLAHRDGRRRTPLHWAAGCGTPAIVRLMLERGAQANARDASELTPLAIAARHGIVSAVKRLLRAGAALEARDSSGYGPLSHAVWAGNRQIAAILTKKGAKVDSFCAAGLGRIDEVARVLQSDRRVLSARDGRGRTLLHWAASAGRMTMARYLLESGVPVNARSPTGCTALVVAVQRDYYALAKLLLESGADASKASQEAWGRLLAEAAGEGAKERIAFMLSTGVDANCRADDGATALLAATDQRRSALVTYLIEQGASTTVGNQWFTPLHMAVQTGDAGIAETLLKHGADVNAQDFAGETPLHRAVTWGGRARARMAMIELLLKNEADVMVADSAGRTPLDWARALGMKGAVEAMTSRKRRDTHHSMPTTKERSRGPGDTIRK